MSITIREVTMNDAKLLFDWTNEPVTRQNSFNPELINWNTHVNWLNKRLEDSNYKIYILQKNNDPIGVVRFETTNQTIIGITVASKMRGKGFGSEILKMACSKFLENSKNDIFAYIKKDNVSSLKAFQKAGFTFYKEAIYQNTACVILTLKTQ